MLLSSKNCIHTSKLRFCVELLGEFLHGVWYWYTSIKSRTTLKIQILDEISFKNVFLNICLAINA
jgi:hypothetical protein